MKLLRVFYFLSIAFLFAGCGSEDEQEVTSSTTISTNMSDYSIISSLGLDTTSVVDLGEYYVAEGDILLFKNKITEYLYKDDATSITKQARTSSIVNDTNIKNVKVKIDESLGGVSNWTEALENAILLYNNTITNIYITKVTSDYDLLIKEDTSIGSDVLGQGTFPASGKVGELIKINTNYNYLSLSQKIFLLVHELGHNLGLRHTNWSGLGEAETGIGIDGTPNSGSSPDPSSVMNGRTGSYYWSNFSYYDIVALHALYPRTNFKIKASVANISALGIVEYTINNYSGSATWTAVENATIVSGQGSNTATFSASGNDFIKVSAEYYDSNYSFTLYDNSSVWVGKPYGPNIVTGVSIFNANQGYDLSATANGATTLEWSVSGATFIRGNSGEKVSIKINNFNTDSQVTIIVKATNQYGSIQSTKIMPVKGVSGSPDTDI